MKFVHACIVSVIILCASYLFFSVSNNLDARGVSSSRSSIPYPIVANPPCVVDDNCNSGLLCNAGFCENIFACDPLVDATWTDPDDFTAGGAFDWVTHEEGLELVPMDTGNYALRAHGVDGVHTYERAVGKDFDPPLRAWGGKADVNLSKVKDADFISIVAFIGAYSDNSLKRNFAVYSSTKVVSLEKMFSFNVYNYTNLGFTFNSEIFLPDAVTEWPDRYVTIEWYVTPQFNGFARVDNQKWVEIPTDMMRHLDSFTKFRAGWVSSYNGGYIDFSRIQLYDGSCLSDPTGGQNADIQITSVEIPQSMEIGERYRMSFEVTNNGPDTGDTIQFIYDYPEQQFDIVPMRFPGCMDNGAEYVCMFQYIDEPYPVYMYIEPTKRVKISSAAQVSPYAADTILNNNATYLLTETFITTDLEVRMSEQNDGVYEKGDPIEFIIEYQNNGPKPVTDGLVQMQIEYNPRILQIDGFDDGGANCYHDDYGAHACEVDELYPYLKKLNRITMRGTLLVGGSFNAETRISSYNVIDKKIENNTSFVPITVSGSPILPDFYYSPEEGTAPLEVEFDGEYSYSTNGDITDYHWDFGDGATSDEMYVFHTFTEAGDYPVTLTVTDPAGAVDSITKTVTVTPQAVCVLVATPAKGPVPLDVTFTLENNHAANLLPRYFSFGDNKRFFLTNPEFPLEHSYKKAGTYTAALRMENGDNNYITCSAKISVDASKDKDDQKTDRKQVIPNSSRIIEKTPEPVGEESTEKESEEEEPTEPTMTEPEPETGKTSPRFVRVE